jgi:hypothetical protein
MSEHISRQLFNFCRQSDISSLNDITIWDCRIIIGFVQKEQEKMAVVTSSGDLPTTCEAHPLAGYQHEWSGVQYFREGSPHPAVIFDHRFYCSECGLKLSAEGKNAT